MGRPSPVFLLVLEVLATGMRDVEAGEIATVPNPETELTYQKGWAKDLRENCIMSDWVPSSFNHFDLHSHFPGLLDACFNMAPACQKLCIFMPAEAQPTKNQKNTRKTLHI